jgi:2,4-dienoyl-CoA reductase-like NADH-dependent reductase (Old Yellow Enzyme family)
MSRLFESCHIRNLVIPNRFIRSATADYLDDVRGFVTPRKINLYVELAEGGIGLIITGTATVYHHPGLRWPRSSYITEDESVPHFRRLVEAVHARGSKIAVQLFHDGLEESALLQDRGYEALGPSELPEDPRPHKAMTQEEIRRLIRAFGDGARRAKDAGFDAVQLNGAHGYLFSQFLSPFTNRRQDEWGGSLENRLRFHHEVLRAMRSAVGEEYPLMIKLGVEDAIPSGLQFEEGKEAARRLAEWGFDALEISNGIPGKDPRDGAARPDIHTVEEEAYFRAWAREIKQMVKVPVIAVGGLRSFEVCEDIVHKGDADFVAMSRPFIREPGLIFDWARGDRHRATCTSCNLCSDRLEEDLACWLDAV